MSNSSSSFTNKTESEVSSRPTTTTTEFHGGPNATADDELRKPDQTTSTGSSENPNTNPCLDLLKTSNQGGVVQDINNYHDEINASSFTTPTSSDHKIPSPKHCPPAPRKPWSAAQPPPPPSHLRKRKGSPSSDIIPFRDLDLFFIDQELQGDSVLNPHKVKKPRTHDHDINNNNNQDN